MRIFIALDLPRQAIDAIKDIQALFKKRNLLTGKFTEPENLHLTLKFLGEIDRDKVEEVQERLKEIKFDSFEAEFGKVGVFSSRYKSYIRVLWIKLTGSGVFELQKEIDDKLKDLFKPEERFMSHITIARIKNVWDKKALLEYLKSIKGKKIKFKVDKFFLKKSELFSEGPVYEDIEGYKLINNA